MQVEKLRSFLNPSLNAFSFVFSLYKSMFIAQNLIQSLPTSQIHLGAYNSNSISMANSAFGISFKGFKRAFMAVVTCIVPLGGAIVGTITGAIKGPTTEPGLIRGACVGAITGAITALQLMDTIFDDEPISKVSLLISLVNGQSFTEWMGAALLKAYLGPISGVESTFMDIFDEFEENVSKGLCKDSINKLPRCIFQKSCKEIEGIRSHDISCAICLSSFKSREEGRELPICKHVFHLKCIDEWLIRSGSCPICRREV